MMEIFKNKFIFFYFYVKCVYLKYVKDIVFVKNKIGIKV